MRPPLYFDGEPDTFRQLRQLFAPVSRLRVRYATPDRRRMQLRTPAAGPSRDFSHKPRLTRAA